ncbi:hypothetical protein Tco_1110305 [Tanacetum coccineum]|uniref:Uncharacterized protein n=1 Tax=Tanacetum coccineum TaxID=301880 RepID=A0ABQ5IIH0_9ASTR
MAEIDSKEAQKQLKAGICLRIPSHNKHTWFLLSQKKHKLQVQEMKTSAINIVFCKPLWHLSLNSKLIPAGSVIVPAGSVIVPAGSVITAGSVIVPAGSVIVPAGSVIAPAGSVNDYWASVSMFSVSVMFSASLDI